MSERTARTIGILGVLLVILTIPIYFLDLLLVSPAVDHCPAQPTDNRDIVLWVYLAGVALWAAGIVLSIIAITQRPSRVTGIVTIILAAAIPFAALPGMYILLGGDCFVPAAMLGLG